jgi:hypothetical protein
LVKRAYNPGDPVVYQVTKHSNHPGVRATSITPATQGDQYSYIVKKFWRIVEHTPDGKVVAQTRRGKRRVISLDDPCLRHVTWWERIVYRTRLANLLDKKQ